MRFLAISPQLAYAMLAAIFALVVLLYWLRRRPPQLSVSSTQLWMRVVASRKRWTVDWRWLRSLLLALTIALSIALAITRPEFPAFGVESQRIVLILDNSPSMAARTRDGASRWLHALERARGIANALSPVSQLMVVDTMGLSEPSGFLSRDAAIDSLSRLPVASFGAARLPPVAAEGSGAQIHLITDGVSLGGIPGGVIIHSVFEDADNVAITAFDARPHQQDPTRYQALVQVVNASQRKTQVRLTIRGGEKFVLSRDLEIAAEQSADEIFDVTDFDHGILRAEVSAQQDAFDLDNIAYNVVAIHRARRVLLVTPGNRFLENAIRSLPGIGLTTLDPSTYQPSEEIDAYVFDRFAPAVAPAAGMILFRPPAIAWLDAASGTISRPVITHWDRLHPLTSGVAWRSLRLERALVADDVAAAASGIVWAKGSVAGSVITARDLEKRRIQVGFALHDSNFSLQPGFVVFLGNALRWLTSAPDALSRDLGTVEVPLADAVVYDYEGTRVEAIRTIGGTAFEATRPGVYTASSAQGRLQVVCNILDPRYAQINRSHFAGWPGAGMYIQTRSGWWSLEPWVVLLGLAALLLVAEWAAFSRRITV